METDAWRQTPDEILAGILATEAKKGRGKLTVFFGMAPGVGKTYAMLEAAAVEQGKGRDVLVGVVETHGRKETEALVEGLEVLPRKSMVYRDIEMQEFDLDEAVKRKPGLILMDELAHTNVPGSRHAKRYQDIDELLLQGIDVYTTVNVQHLESRADTVASITGIVVRETVPDVVVTNADFIQLVDLTPSQLRERLEEGKIYMVERAKVAVDNFFKEANLAALREMALRLTAEWVDHELTDIRRDSSDRNVIWRSGSRLMVAVGPSPFSTRLVRWTRRMAYSMNASWIALSIETGQILSPEDKVRLDKNLELARLLGAEVMVVPGSDIAETLLRVAHLHNVSQIVVGKPREEPIFGIFHRATLVDKLIRGSGEIDVYVVPAEAKNSNAAWKRSRRPVMWDSREGIWLAAGLAAATGLGLLSVPFLGYFTPSFFYMIVVVLLGLFVRPSMVFLGALLSAALWNLLFIPPLYTFEIAQSQDVFMCLFFLVISLIIGRLTSRLRAQERLEHARTDRASTLFLFTSDVAASQSLDEMIARAEDRIFEWSGASLAVFLPHGQSDRVVLHSQKGEVVVDAKESSVADWCWKNCQSAGRGTQTLPGARGFFIPMMSGNRCMGVLGIWPEIPLETPDRHLLGNMTSQLAMTLEREELEILKSKAMVMEASEKLNRSLLDSVSHEFKTPLAVISGTGEQLAQRLEAGGDEKNLRLCREILTASDRLLRLIRNLLDMTRLESGGLKIREDWCSAEDIVECAFDATRSERKNHPADVSGLEGMPLFKADFSLFEQALVNLILNACVHTPDGTRLTLRGNCENNEIHLDVMDDGPGIPDEMKDCLFDRFRGTGTGGSGLGLSIVKGFMEAQGGRIELIPSAKGAHFRLILPFREETAHA